MILAEKYRCRIGDWEFCGFEMILASLVRYKSERKCDHEMELMRGKIKKIKEYIERMRVFREASKELGEEKDE